MKKDFQDQTDEELLLSLADGEEKALDILYMRHSGRVLSYVLKRGLPKEQADDVLQIVFLQVFRKKHLYDPKHAALAWIYVITRSELKDYKNREIKDFLEWDDSLSQTVAASPIIESKEESEALLKELKPREQEVLRMRYLDEMEYDEIAERLQESTSNIRQLVSRSLKVLRRRHERH
ncbi:MAG: sigma-70 family RNA polymerase sigma factor [Bdellovibrio sp.]|nr:sigma-70 family RNA polymerase sigma factor [Bdellovibrio sp.]